MSLFAKAAAVADYQRYTDAQLLELLQRFDAAVSAEKLVPAGTLATRGRIVAALRAKRGTTTVVRVVQSDTPVELKRSRAQADAAERAVGAALVLPSPLANRGELSLAQRSSLHAHRAALV